jgi:hypothetical protein
MAPRKDPGIRNGRGRYVRTVEQAEKDAEIARYLMGRTYRETADHFGLAASTVHEANQRAIDAAIQPAGDEVLANELIKLDVAEYAILRVLRAHHVTVSDGRIVRDDNEAVTDDKPVLDAVRAWVPILTHRAKLRGLFAPERFEVTDPNGGSDLATELSAFLAGVDSAARGSAEVAPGVAPDSAT